MNTAAAVDELRRALLQFVQTIDSTGGTATDEEECEYPVQAPEWLDLGYAYRRAVDVLKATEEVTQ